MVDWEIITNRVSRMEGVRDVLESQQVTLDKRIIESSKEQDVLSEAREVVLLTHRYIHEQLEIRISNIVTTALDVVFDDPYQFRLEFSVRGSSHSEARPILSRRGQEYDAILDCWGGVVDVVSFALRLACLLLSHPAPDKILILDEPFRFVSQDLQVRVRDMMEMLSRELGVQFLIVTHEDELKKDY